MKFGFIRVAAATPTIRVADCVYNTDQIIRYIHEADDNRTSILVFPELCITGYTCGDLFLQDSLLNAALEGLDRIIASTKGRDVFCAVGLPYMFKGKLYNVAAIIQNGQLLGLVPKQNIPNYSEFYECRHFNKGSFKNEKITYAGYDVLFGCGQVFKAADIDNLVIGVEICEDLWVAQPPSGILAGAGATVILNLSASDETTGKDVYRRQLVEGQSARLLCGYIYADAGEGESTTDLVFAGHNLIAENGTLLAESERFNNSMISSEIDLGKLMSERRRINTFASITDAGIEEVMFSYPTIAGKDKLPQLDITRHFRRTPFVPFSADDRKKRCSEIISIQAMGLKKRLSHTKASKAVIGISGGLDSTLCLLVTCKAFDMLGWEHSNIIAVTMPCFGTTDRTYNNAVRLTKELGCTLREINLKAAVIQHFADINHDSEVHDVVYENSQARERTQILMDIANGSNGLVIGTGDLSELAMGWATYNGDHMSMYAVNASVPKTLVRYLVADFAEEAGNITLSEILLDILDTPVSPELLPPTDDGKISQETESLVGPYELHDFFLYYVMRFGFSPAKVFMLALNAFSDDYDDETVLKWLKVFYRRFFTQQFKRSCLPDGPKVGSVALSPRGDWRMPSDSSIAVWQAELDSIEL